MEDNSSYCVFIASVASFVYIFKCWLYFSLSIFTSLTWGDLSPLAFLRFSCFVFSILSLRSDFSHCLFSKFLFNFSSWSEISSAGFLRISLSFFNSNSFFSSSSFNFLFFSSSSCFFLASCSSRHFWCFSLSFPTSSLNFLNSSFLLLDFFFF